MGKPISYLIHVLCDKGSFLGNEDLKNWLNLSIFMLDLMKSGKAWRNMIGQIA